MLAMLPLVRIYGGKTVASVSSAFALMSGLAAIGFLAVTVVANHLSTEP